MRSKCLWKILHNVMPDIQAQVYEFNILASALARNAKPDSSL